MTTRETSETEAERQARLTKQLLWSAAKMDAAMAGQDKFDQARTIMRMFREAEIIIGLCPDASCNGGYVRCLMKGDPNNPNAKVPIAAMFRESPEHSELTSRLYYTIMLNEDQEVASEAWRMWVDITPANVEATRSRNRAGT